MGGRGSSKVQLVLEILLILLLPLQAGLLPEAGGLMPAGQTDRTDRHHQGGPTGQVLRASWELARSPTGRRAASPTALRRPEQRPWPPVSATAQDRRARRVAPGGATSHSRDMWHLVVEAAEQQRDELVEEGVPVPQVQKPAPHHAGHRLPHLCGEPVQAQPGLGSAGGPVRAWAWPPGPPPRAPSGACSARRSSQAWSGNAGARSTPQPKSSGFWPDPQNLALQSKEVPTAFCVGTNPPARKPAGPPLSTSSDVS